MAVVEEFKLDDLWLLWRNTPEGVYLTVRPDILPAERSIERIKERLIGSRVMNFDPVRIAAAIGRASGEPELVGAPFVRFNDEKLRHLFLQVSPFQVRMAVRSSILNTDLRITRADVDFLLMEKGVVHGIDWETIDYLLAGEVYDQETIVASADPPLNGIDGEICEMIAIDPDARPVLLDDGSVDYRNLENIRKVGPGDVVCVRVPPTQGIAGTSVYGKPLYPQSGRDIRLPAGSNLVENADHTQMTAACAGYLYRRNGLIHVGNIYVVHGDVCFKSGNVDYCGDVLVQGNVLTDFRVVADGDITIEGAVEGAEIISRNGNVVIRDALFGKGKAVVRAANNILLGVAQDCELQAGGEIKVRRYLRNSQVQAKSVNAAFPECEISGCRIHFAESVRACQLGSKNANPNQLVLVEHEREKYMAQAQDLEVAVGKLRLAVQELENRLKVARIQLRSQAISPPPELTNRVQLLGSQLQAIQSKLEWAEERRKRTLRYLDVLPDRADLVQADLLEPILKVSIYGQEKEYRAAVSKWRIGWKSGTIRMESA